jgi:hypothetical protein
VVVGGDAIERYAGPGPQRGSAHDFIMRRSSCS